MNLHALKEIREIAELKRQLEEVKLRPVLVARQALLARVANLRQQKALPSPPVSDPAGVLAFGKHMDFLDQALRDTLIELSRLEARLAQQSPALSRAKAQSDVAESLLNSERHRLARQKAKKALEDPT